MSIIHFRLMPSVYCLVIIGVLFCSGCRDGDESRNEASSLEGNVSRQDKGVSPMRISLRGTTIQRMPDWIDIIVSEPEEHLNAFINETGATIISNIPNAARQYGRPVHFAKYSDYPQQIEGDTVYTFLLPASDDVESIIRKHNLSGPDIIRDKYSIPYARYAAEVHHYVIFSVYSASRYVCHDHPEVVSSEPDKCSVCDRKLLYDGGTYEYYLP